MEDIEYERRWLVEDVNAAVYGHHPTVVRQAYLFAKDGWCVRVRRTLTVGGSRAETDSETHNTLAVKGPRVGVQRIEHVWAIPDGVAIELYRRAAFKVVKSRFNIVSLGRLWEIDVFHHDNEDLVIAECEFSPGDSAISVPPWCGREITTDHRYDNECLAQWPFRRWDTPVVGDGEVDDTEEPGKPDDAPDVE